MAQRSAPAAGSGMKQEALFEVSVSDLRRAPRRKSGTDPSLSRGKDDEPTAPLVSLAECIDASVAPVDRAALAIELRASVEELIDASIREANAAGMTWREIGLRLEIPFQTLHRRFGGPR